METTKSGYTLPSTPSGFDSWRDVYAEALKYVELAADGKADPVKKVTFLCDYRLDEPSQVSYYFSDITQYAALEAYQASALSSADYRTLHIAMQSSSSSAVRFQNHDQLLGWLDSRHEEALMRESKKRR